VPLGQIRRHDVIQPLFSISVIMTNIEKSYLHMSMSSYGETLGRQDKHCTNVARYGETQDWYSTQFSHIWKNVYKRRLVNCECILVRRKVEQTKLISFEITKVRRNVEKSYRTCWLQMHYSREKHCQRTKVQRQVEETPRLIKYATTNLRWSVIRQN